MIFEDENGFIFKQHVTQTCSLRDSKFPFVLEHFLVFV